MAILKKMLGLPEEEKEIEYDDIEIQNEPKTPKKYTENTNKKQKPKKQRKHEELNVSAYDKLEFIIVDKDVDIIELGEKLMYGIPLVLNYSRCEVKFANKSLQFLSGVIFALDGEIEQLTDKIYMFISLEDYQEKEIKKFIKDYKEN